MPPFRAGAGAGLVAAMTVGLALSGCSGGSSSPVPTPTPSSGSAQPTAAEGATELRIVVTAGDSTMGVPRDSDTTLTCDPVGGTHPRARRACRFLAAGAEQGADPFAPVPPDRVCAEIYGGSQTALVTGTWNGEPVDAQFSRTNGCEIARWDQVSVLLDPR